MKGDVKMANARDNEKTIREFLESWATYDCPKVISYYAEDAHYKCQATQSEVFDRKTAGLYWDVWFEGCKEFRADIKHIFATDKMACAEYICHQIYTGGWPLIPPEVKVPVTLDIPVLSIFEFNDAGEIQSHRDYWNLFAVMTELGMLAAKDFAWTKDEDKFVQDRM